MFWLDHISSLHEAEFWTVEQFCIFDFEEMDEVVWELLIIWSGIHETILRLKDEAVSELSQTGALTHIKYQQTDR